MPGFVSDCPCSRLPSESRLDSCDAADLRPIRAHSSEQQRCRRIATRDDELHLRHVERVPLGTTYPKLIEWIGKVYDVVPAPRDLVIDSTGVAI